MKTSTSLALVTLLLVPLLLAGCAAQDIPSTRPEPSPGLATGSFTAELNGFDIHYEVHGQGPVVMTVPNSWGLTLDGLRVLYRPLEAHLTMVYFDPRGMGRSASIREDTDMSAAAVRADFDALRRHLGLGKVHAMGWSNGAMNLLFLALDHPDTLASAIFVHGGASYTLEDRQAIAVRYPEASLRYVAFLQEMQASDAPAAEKDARIKRFFIEESFPLMFADREAARPKLAAMYAETGFSWNHFRYVGVEFPSFDLRDRLAEITTRSLVIAGVHDMSPPSKVEVLHRGLPDSEFVVFDDSGHFAPVEETEKFVATVLEFLGVAGAE